LPCHRRKRRRLRLPSLLKPLPRPRLKPPTPEDFLEAYLEEDQVDSAREDLIKVDLAKEDLTQEDLVKVDLIKVDLAREDLTQEDLARVDLTQVDSAKVDSTKADLARVDLTKEDSVVSVKEVSTREDHPPVDTGARPLKARTTAARTTPKPQRTPSPHR